MDLKIDKGIPIPTSRTGWSPWRRLEPGDSAFVPWRRQTSVSSTLCSKAMRREGYRFILRACTEDGVKGVRVWRVDGLEPSTE